MRKLTDSEKVAFRRCIEIQLRLFNNDKQSEILTILNGVKTTLEEAGKESDEVVKQIQYIQNEIIEKIPAREYMENWFRHLYNNWLNDVDVGDE